MSKAAAANCRVILLVFVAANLAIAQDLTPRAYLITPTSSNAVTVSSSWNRGDISFDPALPIENSTGSFQVPVLSLYHSYGLLGRSSNIVVSLPYAVGNFQADIAGSRQHVYRSGLADARVRVAINLRGGRAMKLREFLQWREKGLVGASLTLVIPTGQNDPARAINPGTNRWAFKPEMGITRRWSRWLAEAHGGVWFFRPNRSFFPGDSMRTQSPMMSLEGHFGYYLKPRLWVSLDGNFWNGGRTSVNGLPKQDLQRNSRIGVSFSTPVSRHQSLKISYSRGTYVSIGGDFQTVSAAWQYSWIGMPR